MTNNLSIEKKSKMSSKQLLNLYITSGGKKASYEEVLRASQKEKRENRIKELKSKYGWLFPIIIVFYLISVTADEATTVHT